MVGTLDTKPQRCLFTTQQPVSSQPRLQDFTLQLMMLTSYITKEPTDYTEFSKYYTTSNRNDTCCIITKQVQLPQGLS
jgi:hypothetical protein